MALDYFYDEQLRRYWTQFVRIFEGFQYRTGRDASGQVSFRTVPAKLASKDRLVGHILRNNSENTTMSTPQISCWMSAITRAPERVQSPNFVSSVNVVERAIDPLTNRYTGEAGRTYTVERMMGVPYDMTMNVDIWTSNENQKAQLLEQILTLFNPSIDLQTSDNPLDWSALTIVELLDVSYSSRSFPIGTEDDIDIATLTFKVPIWINPPAKVKRQNIIQQIITNISTSVTEVKTDDVVKDVHWSESDQRSRLIVTPGDHRIYVSREEASDERYFVATLLNSGGGETSSSGDPLDWSKLLSLYGRIRPGISQLRLKTTNNIENHDSDIVATFDLDSKSNRLILNLAMETLPVSTLASITGVVNPKANNPNNTGVFTSPTVGDRWMILSDISATDDPSWGGLQADNQDIIEWDGSAWKVSFDASNTEEIVRVTHRTTAVQYKWTGAEWSNSIEGEYSPGYWRVFL